MQVFFDFFLTPSLRLGYLYKNKCFAKCRESKSDLTVGPQPLQKERSPGISPGSVWFRVPKVAPGITRRLRWWGNLGRIYGADYNVVCYGETFRGASSDGANQKLTQKNALRRRTQASLRKEAAVIGGGPFPVLVLFRQRQFIGARNRYYL
jgi:hypothetical protein